MRNYKPKVGKQRARRDPGDWVAGPQLIEWLEENGIPLTQEYVGDTLARRIREWRKGRHASVYTVDELLIRTGGKRYISDIPEEYFGLPHQPRGTPYPKEVKKWALKELKTRPMMEVAREVGCSGRTLRQWKEAAAK